MATTDDPVALGFKSSSVVARSVAGGFRGDAGTSRCACKPVWGERFSSRPVRRLRVPAPRASRRSAAQASRRSSQSDGSALRGGLTRPGGCAGSPVNKAGEAALPAPARRSAKENVYA